MSAKKDLSESNQAVEMLDKHLTPAKAKGISRQWYAPGKGYAVNMPLMGSLQLMRYSMFPVSYGHPAMGSSYKVFMDKAGGGLKIAPHWRLVKTDIPESKVEAVIKLVKGEGSIKDVLSKELASAESKEGFKMPSKAKNAAIAYAEKLAKRRLGAKNTPKAEFFHFDTAKNYKMDSWGSVSGLSEDIAAVANRLREAVGYKVMTPNNKNTYAMTPEMKKMLSIKGMKSRDGSDFHDVTPDRKPGKPKMSDKKAMNTLLGKTKGKESKAGVATPIPKGNGMHEAVNILSPGPKTSGSSDADKLCEMITKQVGKAVQGKYFECRVDTRFGGGTVFVRYANVPSDAQHLTLMNAKVAVHFSIGDFNDEGVMKGPKLKASVMSKRGIKPRGKSGTLEQIAKHVASTVTKAAAMEEGVDYESRLSRIAGIAEFIRPGFEDSVAMEEAVATDALTLELAGVKSIYPGLEEESKSKVEGAIAKSFRKIKLR